MSTDVLADIHKLRDVALLAKFNPVRIAISELGYAYLLSEHHDLFTDCPAHTAVFGVRLDVSRYLPNGYAVLTYADGSMSILNMTTGNVTSLGKPDPVLNPVMPPLTP